MSSLGLCVNMLKTNQSLRDLSFTLLYYKLQFTHYCLLSKINLKEYISLDLSISSYSLIMYIVFLLYHSFKSHLALEDHQQLPDHQTVKPVDLFIRLDSALYPNLQPSFALHSFAFSD